MALNYYPSIVHPQICETSGVEIVLVVEVDTTIGVAIGGVLVQEEVLVLLLLVLPGPLELEVGVQGDLDPPALGHRSGRDVNQGAGG